MDLDLANMFCRWVDRVGYDEACKFMHAVYNKRWEKQQDIIYQWYDYEFKNLDNLIKEKTK